MFSGPHSVGGSSVSVQEQTKCLIVSQLRRCQIGIADSGQTVPTILLFRAETIQLDFGNPLSNNNTCLKPVFQ